MGANENAAVVRRGYEAFNSGDMETLTEIFDESWTFIVDSPPVAGWLGH